MGERRSVDVCGYRMGVSTLLEYRQDTSRWTDGCWLATFSRRQVSTSPTIITAEQFLDSSRHLRPPPLPSPDQK